MSYKDIGRQAGREIVIRFNVFGPSSLVRGGNTGTHGLNQGKQIDCIRIHHNLFFEKGGGVCVDGPPPKKGMVIHHNTFVNCRTDLWGWTNAPVQAHHNVFYHANRGARFLDLQGDPLAKLRIDRNLYFAAASDAQWRHKYRGRASTLSNWQKYSGKDAHSVWNDPGFVHPGGSRPEDFKRKDSTDFDIADGSKYERVCGAYVTGNEIVGVEMKQEK